jgi:hypothetical protein
MAKRARRSDRLETEQPAGTQLAAAAESKLEAFAEDLGRLLGRAQVKAQGWLDQRKTIAEQLMQIRDAAEGLLGELAGRAAQSARTARRGRPATRKASGPAASAASGKRKRTMSAEARAKISAAQRARWARQKKAKGQ